MSGAGEGRWGRRGGRGVYSGGMTTATGTDTDTQQDTLAGDAIGDPVAVDAAVEALLFSSDRPTPASRLGEALAAAGVLEGEGATAAVDAAVERLNAEYAERGRAFRVEAVAGGYRVMTLPEHARVLAAYHKGRGASKLTRAALETLAIIAYKQPLTRARLEAIRGVGCGEVLRSLLERRLIAVVGRAEELGRPMLYGTTKAFLDAFGLKNLKDLPTAGELAGLGLGTVGTRPKDAKSAEGAAENAPSNEPAVAESEVEGGAEAGAEAGSGEDEQVTQPGGGD